MGKYERTGYSWEEFREKSDKEYAAALAGKEARLAKHNIIREGDLELRFVFDIAKLYWGSTPLRRALDAGCGHGYMTDQLRQAGCEAVGFDISESAVRLAQKRFPDAVFRVGDGASPAALFSGERFDFVLARELHPFTRIDDFDFQRRILSEYLSLLTDGGIMAVAHARAGGGMSFGSLDFDKASRWLAAEGYAVAGPFTFFPFKHLEIRPRSCSVLNVVSAVGRILSRILGQRWIEYFVIRKPYGVSIRLHT